MLRCPHRPRRRTAEAVSGLLLVGVLGAACGASDPVEVAPTAPPTSSTPSASTRLLPSGPGDLDPTDVPHPSSTDPSSTHPARTIGPPLPASLTDLAYDRFSQRERVGQLFMFGALTTGPTRKQVRQFERHGAGNVFLRGPSDLGAATTAGIVRSMVKVTRHHRVNPFVSADQEGGNAQALEGEGFSDMPTAFSQGLQARADRVSLREDAGRWAGELLTAGVNLDLAPVADVVPAVIGTDNAPIGFFYREYGNTTGVVAPGVQAFVKGMGRAGVATAVKHFPGLGEATGNTDSDPSVTAPTTAEDESLKAFRAGIRADAPMVMVSSATYPELDPDNRACFSSRIMNGLLREQLGFDKVIVSDSFGSASVAGTPPGPRAIRFLRAGGTMVLDTNSDDIRPMIKAVLDLTRARPRFAALVEQDVRRVLAVKEEYGLIGG